MPLLNDLLNLMPFHVAREVGPKVIAGWSISRNFEGMILKPLESSTCTVNGQFSNVQFNEQKDMHLFNAEYPIIQVGSNYGELFAPEYPNHKEEKLEVGDKPAKSNRGRKPKEKDVKTRKIGNGKYFNSQTTFVYASDEPIVKPDKLRLVRNGQPIDVAVYKIKVFRNGVFAIPGVVNLDLRDSNAPISYMESYLSRCFNQSVKATNLRTDLRNCKTMIDDPQLLINIDRFGKLLSLEKTRSPDLQILDVEYMTAQRAAQIKIKFLRPRPDNPTKYATVKILRQKVDFEGFTEYEDIQKVYDWLNGFMIKNFQSLTFTTEEEESDLDESSDSSSDDEKTPPPTQTKKKSYAFDTYNVDTDSE
jgi:hypothetical protein